jgi:Leucine-rich repeat (LRR) protein
MVKVLSIKHHEEKKVKKVTSLLDRIEECDRWGQFDLDISHLGLLEWPPELLILPGVRNLKAHKNNLINIPDLSKTFRQLEILNLSRNKIIQLNQIQFSHFIVLKSVDISRNELQEIPIELTKVILLSSLYVQQNKIKNFPDGMKDMLNLRLLDASDNCIEYVGDKLEGVPRLEILNLSGNPNLQITTMSDRTRMLYEKRKLLASKDERRALVKRALGIQKAVLLKEESNIMVQLNKYP